jgi:hypothetical protein
MMLFRRGKKRVEDLSPLEGVITFFSSHHALKGEKVLLESDRKAVLIPGPREISPNCGTALRFDYTQKTNISNIFKKHFVKFEAIHYYPVTEELAR